MLNAHRILKNQNNTSFTDLELKRARQEEEREREEKMQKEKKEKEEEELRRKREVEESRKKQLMEKARAEEGILTLELSITIMLKYPKNPDTAKSIILPQMSGSCPRHSKNSSTMVGPSPTP